MKGREGWGREGRGREEGKERGGKEGRGKGKRRRRDGTTRNKKLVIRACVGTFRRGSCSLIPTGCLRGLAAKTAGACAVPTWLAAYTVQVPSLVWWDICQGYWCADAPRLVCRTCRTVRRAGCSL